MEAQEQLQELNPDLNQLSQLALSLADEYDGDCQKLLQLLRVLEYLHRHIRDTTFQNAFPKNRQALYKLLRTIESERGWPYIPVMPLRDFMEHLRTDLAETPEGSELTSSEEN